MWVYVDAKLKHKQKHLSSIYFSCGQEFKAFKKFADSLLSKSGKLTDLMSQLESEVESKEAQSGDRKRAEKPSAELIVVN